jgi:hypothetical protein
LVWTKYGIFCQFSLLAHMDVWFDFGKTKYSFGMAVHSTAVELCYIKVNSEIILSG